MTHSVWAVLHLSRESELTLRRLFVDKLGFPSGMLKRGLHTTVYHARRPLPGLQDFEEPVLISVPGEELRMMALAPGGENPRPDIDPRNCLIGLRIRRAQGAADGIETIRQRFFIYETRQVLGSRPPSGARRSAFGARSYQPHITVLKAGAVTDADLSKIGKLVRENVQQLHFDRLVVKCRDGGRL